MPCRLFHATLASQNQDQTCTLRAKRSNIDRKQEQGMAAPTKLLRKIFLRMRNCGFDGVRREKQF